MTIDGRIESVGLDPRATSAPAVAVVMPVYNGERWLARALESALAQTFTDFEVVVVDDGSTDGSAAIVDSFAERDPRVRLVRMEHAGVRSARSVSLVEARARFVAFLDADDEWLPHRLERQVPYVDERTVVFSDFWYLRDGDTAKGPRHGELVTMPPLRYPSTELFSHLLRLGCFVHIGTVLAPRMLLLDAGAFRHGEVYGLSAGGSEDWEMWLLLALRRVRYHYVDEPLTLYRRHAESLSGDVARGFERGLHVIEFLMTEASGGDRRLLRRAQRRRRIMLESEYRKRGWRQIIAGEAGPARSSLTRSLRVRPYSPRAWLALSLTLCPPVARRLVRGRV